MQSKKKILVKCLFGIYLVILVYLLFGGQRGVWANMSIWEYALMQTNLVPFKTISGYVTAMFTGSMNFVIPLKNIVGNLLIFLPMGVFVPLFILKNRNLKTYIFILGGIIILVELIQLFTKRGSFDIDDFILNFTGALIGYVLWKVVDKRKRVM